MISKVTLNRIACYKKNAVLETDKKVNLIYGLNGTGKSTISNFFHKRNDARFKHCSIDGLDDDDDILVYNQEFIRENFFEPENLKGIFTLSKANKDAEEKIANAEAEIARIKAAKSSKEEERDKANKELERTQKSAKDKLWAIKTKYSGGDRVLEFCLEGYKGDGLRLLTYIVSIPKPAAKPGRTIDQLKEDLRSLSGDNAQKIEKLKKLAFPGVQIERDTIFEKQIVGNENSTVSEFISRFGCSDWVKLGLKYVSEAMENKNETCPFCQEKTISKELLKDIKSYFDESYESDLNRLNDAFTQYDSDINSLSSSKSVFELNGKMESVRKDFELKYSTLHAIALENKRLIEDKIKSPSLPVSLTSTNTALEDLNSVIDVVNQLTEEHNEKVDNKAKTLSEIKDEFWKLMR